LLLTLPVTVLTMGLFIFVINGLMFWGVANMIDGFHVAGFWSAVGGALLYSVISWTLSTLLLKK
jgi:putative membrane protein